MHNTNYTRVFHLGIYKVNGYGRITTNDSSANGTNGTAQLTKKEVSIAEDLLKIKRLVADIRKYLIDGRSTELANGKLYSRMKELFAINDVEKLERLLFAFNSSAGVKKAVETIKLSYDGVMRKNGTQAIVHLMHLALFEAALGSPDYVVIAALKHDIVEDALKLVGVEYRYMKNGKEMPPLRGRHAILAHIGKEDGYEAKRLVAILTNPEEQTGEKYLIYQKYLASVVKDPVADRLKKLDKLDNLLSLENLPDSIRDGLVKSTIAKGWMQVVETLRDDWLKKILIHALLEVANRAMEESRLAKGTPEIPTRQSEVVLKELDTLLEGKHLPRFRDRSIHGVKRKRLDLGSTLLDTTPIL